MKATGAANLPTPVDSAPGSIGAQSIDVLKACNSGSNIVLFSRGACCILGHLETAKTSKIRPREPTESIESWKLGPVRATIRISNTCTVGLNAFDENYFKNLLTQLTEQPADALENEQLEIKGWCRDERELIEKASDAALCLANAQGGYVLIGVEENARRSFSPCPHPNVSSNWLVHRVQDQTHPPVSCKGIDLTSLLSDFLGIRGPQLYALAIERKRCASGHTNAKGISKVRVGKECRTQFRADDDRTNAVVPGVSLSDLSLESINWAMGQQRKMFTLTEALPDTWEFLAGAELIQENGSSGTDEDRYSVTLAALLLFGKQATLRRDLPYCQTILKTSQANTQLSKNVVEMIRELVATDQARLRQLCPMFPAECLKELLVNAYMHRCWRTSSPVVITITGESIEIENPGDLMPSLHVGNLLYCVPVYRNFRLADGLRFIGLCDKIGQGIDIVFKSLVCGGFDFPTFESANNRFLVQLTQDRSHEFREFIQRRGSSLPYLDELVLLRFLWDQDGATVEQLAIALQRGKDIAQRCVTGMVKKSMVEQDAGSRYRLANSVRSDIQTIFNRDQMGLFEPQA